MSLTENSESFHLHHLLICKCAFSPLLLHSCSSKGVAHTFTHSLANIFVHALHALSNTFHTLIILLANWFDRKNIDDLIIFIQYLLLFCFRLGLLLARIIHSNLEVYFTSAPSWTARYLNIELYLQRMVIWQYDSF